MVAIVQVTVVAVPGEVTCDDDCFFLQQKRPEEQPAMASEGYGLFYTCSRGTGKICFTILQPPPLR